jgi:hypothetical protein
VGSGPCQNAGPLLAPLVWRSFVDAQEAGSVWSSVLSWLAFNPAAAAAMPAYKDTRKGRGNNQISGSAAADGSPSPIDELMKQVGCGKGAGGQCPRWCSNNI